MTRAWTALPIIVVAGLPVWTAPSAPVVLIAVMAGLLCGLGILAHTLTPVTAGGALATIGYALALWSGDAGTDIAGAAAFGLALLALIDLGDIARRWHGADIGAEVARTQLVYGLGRSAIIVAVVALLSLCGAVLAVFIPAGGRAIVAGLGVLIAFAAALYAGVVRGPQQGA